MHVKNNMESLTLFTLRMYTGCIFVIAYKLKFHWGASGITAQRHICAKKFLRLIYNNIRGAFLRNGMNKEDERVKQNDIRDDKSLYILPTLKVLLTLIPRQLRCHHVNL